MTEPDYRTIELWFDTLANVFAFTDSKGKQVRTYRVIEKDDFPATLDLINGPQALSYWPEMKPKYGAPSSSAQTILTWTGVTELHVSPSLDKAGLLYTWSMVGRVLYAAKNNMTLGLATIEFKIPEENGSIQPSVLQYGEENPHYGLLIKWVVVQNLSGQL